MKYYVWLDAHGKSISKAWPYKDEAERMAEESRPPPGAARMRTGSKEQLKSLYRLADEDFVAG